MSGFFSLDHGKWGDFDVRMAVLGIGAFSLYSSVPSISAPDTEPGTC